MYGNERSSNEQNLELEAIHGLCCGWEFASREKEAAESGRELEVERPKYYLPCD